MAVVRFPRSNLHWQKEPFSDFIVMYNLANLLLPLDQRNFSLEDQVSNHIHYLDDCLCTFYKKGLNNTWMTQLSGDGPRESFAEFVEWVLVSNNSLPTIGLPDEELTSPTPDPEQSRTSRLSPEPLPAATKELLPSGATKLRIAPEPEPHCTSNKVREPADGG
ncbi:hypothetical protein E1301_Tti001846 [Triplophysa tibetana]|uniref:Uncharacterized protein n=1 Tax=Triplophysa tibetana TaxID=1572043 RepID=A0A5A9PFG0_9TELE|nr:hypothetical protein E1301_Tti001846 [Triplophysa tibetana]